ncbi:hypothetical protein QMO56_23455 [Roseomonas sp. E05]|uniref:hypothetical protein n=1 Tax=Roseomonas sp. E05 TaxID=3046310 RepID=UPI0024B902D6|nr:hypothetical protein [Roseomonas sp. E05]MDJ0391072.1 hypothetical protein [Roseomonas sp. E05]
MTNKNGPRRGRPTSTPKRSPSLPSIKLHLLLDAPDPDGLPRAALEIPPSPGRNRRPTLLLFASIPAALAAKQRMEAGQ